MEKELQVLREELLKCYGLDINKAKCFFSTQNYAFIDVYKRQEEGRTLKCPTVEFSYKNDALGDPFINHWYALALNLATEEEIEKITETAFAVNEVLRNFFAAAGIELIDFKLEFGRFDGKILLADEISPDTCRLWDSKTKEKLDKDRFRRDMGCLLYTSRCV